MLKRSSTRKLSQIVSFSICIVILLSLFIFPVQAEGDGEITVIACSDFQPKQGHTAGAAVFDSLLATIGKDGIVSADGFLCCGDYDYSSYGDVNMTRAGIAHLKNSLNGIVSEENMVFVQGNHDAAVDSGAGLSPSGNNDRADGAYGVYVIHNDDYMWANKDEQRIKLTAQKLINYLNDKLEEGYDKPIFVLSHLPLHYSMRTYYDGDGKYAGYIFEALNEAAAKGLNLIFMYGHDHSNGWDDYLGGSSVYLQKGDEMLVADYNNAEKSYKTLNFTYLNAGFVGYYNNVNGADDTLTLTVFKIKGGEVSVTRYSESGIHDLKSAGVRNAYKNETGYDPNTAVYPSPQKISLTSVSDDTPIEDIMDIPDSGMRFDAVTSADGLVSGGEYLLVYNSSEDRIMLPSSVTKSDSAGAKRTGFDLESTALFGDSTIFAEISKEYLWTFTQKGDGWYIGDGELYAAIENSSDQKLKAVLKEEGDLFTIDGSAGNFTFSNGTYDLNYNARGVINGYNGNPAAFHIYEFKGYSVEVKKGVAKTDGIEVEYAKEGATVSVTAAGAPEGMVFDHWETVEGGIVLEDKYSATTTFTMTGEAVELRAVYAEAPEESETDPAPEGSDTVTDTEAPDESETGTTAPADPPKNNTIIYVAIAAAAILIVAIGAVLILKK